MDRSVDEALHRALRTHFSDRQLVELAVTVAAANFANRLSSAFDVPAPADAE